MHKLHKAYEKGSSKHCQPFGLEAVRISEIRWDAEVPAESRSR